MKDAHIGWYLVITRPYHETIAKLNLDHQGFHTYLPLSSQHKHRRNRYQLVTEPLFPRYLFIHLNSEIDDWSKIRSTRGCISLVRFGLLPARVPDSLIEQLQSDETTRAIQDKIQSQFKPGDHVRVLDGLLAGYEGIIELKNSQERVTLLLTIAEGHTRRISLPLNQVEMA